jgi:hypothetical protein
MCVGLMKISMGMKCMHMCVCVVFFSISNYYY